MPEVVRNAQIAGGNGTTGGAAAAVHGSRLDPWVDAYAARTAGMTASEIRALFAVASRPEVVSLAGGMPYLSALPLDVARRQLARLVTDRGRVALQYGSGQGDPGLREQILDVMAPAAVSAHPDDVVVTTGSQKALDLVTRDLLSTRATSCSPRRRPTSARSGVFRAYQARGRARPDGRRRARSRRRCERRSRDLGRTGRRVKFALHDPDLPQPGRRHAVGASAVRRSLEIARAVRRPRPRGRPLRPARLRRRARCRRCGRSTARASSTSARSPRRSPPASGSAGPSRRTPCARSSCWPTSPRPCARSAFTQLAVSDYLADHDWLDQIKIFREVYRERARRHARLARRRCMPAAPRWTVPDGGFYVWVTLPEGLDATAMLPRAVTARVAYVPGTGVLRRRPGPAQHCGCRTATRPRADPRGRAPARRRHRGRARASLRDVRRPRHAAGRTAAPAGLA